MNEWLMEVGLKKMLPSLVRGVLAVFVAFLAAHSATLANVGIIYDQATQTITIHLGTLTDWVTALGIGGIASIFAMLQHHVTQAVTGGNK